MKSSVEMGLEFAFTFLVGIITICWQKKSALGNHTLLRKFCSVHNSYSLLLGVIKD